MIADDPLFTNRALKVAAAAIGERVSDITTPWGRKCRIHARWAIMIALKRRGLSTYRIAHRLKVDKTSVQHGIKAGTQRLNQPDFAALFAEVDAA